MRKNRKLLIIVLLVILTCFGVFAFFWLSRPKENIDSIDSKILEHLEILEENFMAFNIGDNIKEEFIKVIDFIFYEGDIKGYKFKDLSGSVKLKVLSMALYFDNRIELYFPGYKETISSKTKRAYNNCKVIIITSYLNLTTKICSNNEDLCKSAKDNFNELKIIFDLSWDLINDLANDGLNNVRDWYEIWSGK